MGMELLASVGQAATCPPRLVTLEYRGDVDPTTGDALSPTIALVGKG
jgi:leucyl aminopeptidase